MSIVYRINIPGLARPGFLSLMRVQEYFALLGEDPLPSATISGEVSPDRFTFAVDREDPFFAPILADLLFLRAEFGDHRSSYLTMSM